MPTNRGNRNLNAAAREVATYYENEIKRHQTTTAALISQLKSLITTAGGSTNEPAQVEGWKQALAFAEHLSGQQQAAATTGNPNFGRDVKSASAKPGGQTNPAVQQQQAALKSEGQIATPNNPNNPAAGSSVFGAIYQAGSTNLNTAGMASLAQAVGSKFSFVLNNKVTPGKLKGLGALKAIIRPGVSIGSIIYSLMSNQDQGTILAVQGELAKAGYLDPLHTTNLTPGFVGFSNDPTLQALATLLDSSSTRNLPVSRLLRQGQQSRQGQDWGKLWTSVVSGAPFSITGHQTNIQSPNALADQLRQATTGSGGVSGGSGSVLAGGAGQNPSNGQTQQFISAAQQYEQNNPSTVTTQYEPQPGLGISGFTRFPLQKDQTTVGGVDQSAMDQFTYSWLVQNFGPDVAATGAANILNAFNQMLGLGSSGTGSAPSSAAGGS